MTTIAACHFCFNGFKATVGRTIRKLASAQSRFHLNMVNPLGNAAMSSGGPRSCRVAGLAIVYRPAKPRIHLTRHGEFWACPPARFCETIASQYPGGELLSPLRGLRPILPSNVSTSVHARSNRH